MADAAALSVGRRRRRPWCAAGPRTRSRGAWTRGAAPAPRASRRGPASPRWPWRPPSAWRRGSAPPLAHPPTHREAGAAAARPAAAGPARAARPRRARAVARGARRDGAAVAVVSRAAGRSAPPAGRPRAASPPGGAARRPPPRRSPRPRCRRRSDEHGQRTPRLGRSARARHEAIPARSPDGLHRDRSAGRAPQAPAHLVHVGVGAVARPRQHDEHAGRSRPPLDARARRRRSEPEGERLAQLLHGAAIDTPRLAAAAGLDDRRARRARRPAWASAPRTSWPATWRPGG